MKCGRPQSAPLQRYQIQSNRGGPSLKVATPEETEVKLQAPLLDNKELVTLVSITECRHRRLITLNHTVELARYTDVSKRLGTLIRVLSHKFSVRDLKRWMGEGSGPTVWEPILGWIELCPKFLTMVQIEKAESAEEMAKRGLGTQAIKQQLAHQYDSCEECEYFRGLNEYW